MSGSKNQPLQTLVLCLVSLVLILLSKIHRTDTIVSAINSTSLYLLRPISLFKNATDYQLSTIYSIPHQYRTVLDLERQLASMQSQAQLARSLEEENKLLRRQLQLRPNLPPQSIVTTITSFNRFALISAGLRQGVKDQSAVVRNNTLIGLVIDVYPNTAKVRLVNDPDFNLEAVTSQGTNGKVTHDGNQLVFTNVLQKDILKIEDSIFSKGSANIPAGLLIGKVHQIISDTSSVYQTATISLPGSYQDQEPVFVLNY